jgi:hypothetical protein
MRSLCALLLLFTPLTVARADGPKDNFPDNVGKIPPPGIKISDEDRHALTEDLKKLQYAIGVLEDKKNPVALQYLPDVKVFEKAVRYALNYDEFFNPKEVAVAKDLIKTGMLRADDLLHAKHPWTTQTGLVVRGYQSNIDGSVQPYGLVIPKDYDFKKKIRLDFWCHGRGEKLTELAFIQQRQTSMGDFPTDKAIVLHLYGRFCCANKLAGEVDCVEALNHVKKNYAIDEDRIVMRGFSMGGAACWQFAVHYPWVWCAAAPGAGFAETPEFLRVFQKEKVQPTWYEQKLWHMYDCTDYALNLFNLPTVAYSGEIDNQKQAADIMAAAMEKEGLKLTHIIGPKTGHSYEKGAKAEIIERIDKIAEKGRNPWPEKIKFVTYTLRYNRCFWLEIERMEKHWERAQVEAEIVGRDTVKVTTKNVTRIVFTIEDLLKPDTDIKLEIDGQRVNTRADPEVTGGQRTGAKGNYYVEVERTDRGWRNVTDTKGTLGFGKTPGLQGPIDDAFLSTFVMVRPTGKPEFDKTSAWVDAELKHAITHWRQQFRGDAPVKDDKDITEADIKHNNLILWGDETSNSIIKKICDKLPVKWHNGKVVAGSENFDMATHMPILIYPNPLNPKKYVVLNSGFTFREYDYLNNARQVPKLPDWAIVDITTPPNSRYPGKIAAAGFFDEQWKLKAEKK